MRMERINDHQVRFFVSLKDLEMRKLSLASLKYGSQEVKELFGEMLRSAGSAEHFNEEGFPLMIEAIPLNPEELMVIISAVEDMEELDPHYARFARLGDAPAPMPQAEGFSEAEIQLPVSPVCLLSFSSVDEVLEFAGKMRGSFSGITKLYRADGGFYLALVAGEGTSLKDFMLYLNIVFEYAVPVEHGMQLYAWLNEHETPVMTDLLK